MMKKLLIAVTLAVLAVLYVGYYEAVIDGDIETVVFIKKHPTFKVKFYKSMPMTVKSEKWST